MKFLTAASLVLFSLAATPTQQAILTTPFTESVTIYSYPTNTEPTADNVATEIPEEIVLQPPNYILDGQAETLVTGTLSSLPEVDLQDAILPLAAQDAEEVSSDSSQSTSRSGQNKNIRRDGWRGKGGIHRVIDGTKSAQGPELSSSSSSSSSSSGEGPTAVKQQKEVVGANFAFDSTNVNY